jgi:hypothetical protein
VKIIYLRDGAAASLEDGFFRFTGAAGSEFLNTRRTTPLSPPMHNLEVKPDTLFKIHSGIGVERDLQSHNIDVRATKAAWRAHGIRVERVDTDEVATGIFELIIYISSMNSFTLNPRETMFESTALCTAGGLEIFTGELPTKANGFVPAAKKQIQDSSVKKAADAQQKPAAEVSDEDKRALMNKWLNEPDDKPGQTVETGGAAVDALAHAKLHGVGTSGDGSGGAKGL